MEQTISSYTVEDLGKVTGIQVSEAVAERLYALHACYGVEFTNEDVSDIAPRIGWSWSDEQILDHLFEKYQLLTFHKKDGTTKSFTFHQLTQKWPMIPHNILQDIIDEVGSGAMVLSTIRDFIEAVQDRRKGLLLSYSEAELKG